jgi:hypothetical protein
MLKERRKNEKEKHKLKWKKKKYGKIYFTKIGSND